MLFNLFINLLDISGNEKHYLELLNGLSEDKLDANDTTGKGEDKKEGSNILDRTLHCHGILTACRSSLVERRQLLKDAISTIQVLLKSSESAVIEQPPLSASSETRDDEISPSTPNSKRRRKNPISESPVKSSKGQV